MSVRESSLKETETCLENERWNQKGIAQIENLKENPEKYIVNESPYSQRQFHNMLMGLLQPFHGRKILEYGCGRGEFSVFLSKQGAELVGIDIAPNLIAASKTLAEINNTNCEFHLMGVTELPFQSDTYDVVMGMGILHHLTELDLKKAIQEAHRVLKDGGMAIFSEPVENSKIFNFIQNIFPVGKKGSSYYRPSILAREDWKNFLAKNDDRALSNKELIGAGEDFKSTSIYPAGFLVRLTRLVGGKFMERVLMSIDVVLLKIAPPLKRLSQTTMVIYKKQEALTRR